MASLPSLLLQFCCVLFPPCSFSIVDFAPPSGHGRKESGTSILNTSTAWPSELDHGLMVSHNTLLESVYWYLISLLTHLVVNTNWELWDYTEAASRSQHNNDLSLVDLHRRPQVDDKWILATHYRNEGFYAGWLLNHRFIIVCSRVLDRTEKAWSPQRTTEQLLVRPCLMV